MDFKRRSPLCRSSNRAASFRRDRANQLPPRCDRLSVPVELTFISFLPGREREFRQLSFGFASANPETRHAMHAPTIPKFHQASFNLSFYLKIVPTDPPSSSFHPTHVSRIDASITQVNSFSRRKELIFSKTRLFVTRDDQGRKKEVMLARCEARGGQRPSTVFPVGRWSEPTTCSEEINRLLAFPAQASTPSSITTRPINHAPRKPIPTLPLYPYRNFSLFFFLLKNRPYFPFSI